MNSCRGKTFIFNQDDASNNGEFLLFSETDGGWHPSSSIGTTSYLYELGVTYTLDGSTVTYAAYIAGFNAATQRRIQIVVPATAPDALYIFGYQTSGLGLRTVQSGYILGDLVQDYIYDSSVGTLDEFNGKFAVTPDYPNGTYAYFMTEDSSGNPVYPYVIGRKFYGTPLFEGNSVPEVLSDFPEVIFPFTKFASYFSTHPHLKLLKIYHYIHYFFQKLHKYSLGQFLVFLLKFCGQPTLVFV